MTMTEYIERKAALSMREPPKSNRQYQTYNLDDAYEQGWYDALCCLEQLPAADVAPVVHGVWACVNKIDPISGYRCSKCRRIVGFDLTPYCPNCGAKMDGGDSNESD